MKNGINNKHWIGIAAAIIIVITIYFFYTSGPKISVNGSSEITAKPDMISIYVISQARNASSSIAQEKVIGISEKFVTELEELGISEEDIELSNYNVYEDFDWSSSSRKSLGYVASQSITVKLEDFNLTFSVIKSATTAGALVSGINYELSQEKQSEYKAQANKKAGEDAKMKAESLAAGFGRRIGRLVSVESQEFNYYPYPLYAKAEGAVSVDSNAQAERAIVGVSPSDLKVSSSILASYTMTRF